VAEFEIKLTELEAGSREYVLPIRAAWLAEQLVDLAGEDFPAASEDGTLDVTAEKSGDDVLVRGHARASITTPCGRCLNAAKFDVDAELAVLMIRRGSDHRPVADEDELTPEEEDREFFTGDELVLDEVVREHLVLELPMQPLCREDCPGIEIPEAIRGPAQLDAVREDAVFDDQGKVIDPRLAPLMALAKKAANTAPPAPPGSSRASSSEPRKKKSRS
jgi:uncharacterized protein